jgi:SAM-dependent methyltransferase
LIGDAPAGKLLEIGPGAATLLIEFAARGFRCTALEPSSDARALAATLLDRTVAQVEICADPLPEWVGSFDYLCAFDVLEHIEDDAAALRQWRAWLKPGATLLMSVPARMSLWTAGDEWAGHFRRYERQPLLDLLESGGFAIEAFECYGFPLTNASERLSASAYRKLIHRQAEDADENRRLNNDRSGIDRRPHLRLFPLLSSIPGRVAIRGFMRLQELFLGKDWGSGYILRARRL